MNPFIPVAVQELLDKPMAYFEAHPSDPPSGKAPLTNIAFVLDCSGSMAHGKEETIEGFNQQVETVRLGSMEAGKTTFTDVHFSSAVNIRSVAGSLDDLKPLNSEGYVTDGNTSLLDAIGSTVAALLQTSDINAPDTATLVTTFTDGQENASRIYDATTIKAMVERLEATGRWTFALVGPQLTIRSLAEQLAVKAENSLGYDERLIAKKREAFSKVASANVAFMKARAEGKLKPGEFFIGDDKT